MKNPLLSFLFPLLCGGLLAALLLGSGCGGSSSATPDGAPAADRSAPADVVRIDAGAPDTAARPDAPQKCGPDIYPCGPYGTQKDNLIEDLTFLGFRDDKGTGKLLDNPYRLIALHEFFREKKARVLLVNVAAGWCTACQEENLDLIAMFPDYKAKGAEFMEVVFETRMQNEPADRVFIEEDWIPVQELNFTTVCDPTLKMGRYFDVAATPLNMIVRLSDMKIVYWETGYNKNDLRQALDDLLQ